MKQTLLTVAALSLVAAPVFAQTTTTATSTAPAAQVGTTTEKVSELQSNEEKMKENTQITNAKLAAEAGSKSKWSMKMNLNYSGGTVERPFQKDRPNYRAGANVDAKTALAGTVAIARRLSDTTALRIGTGVSARTPFHNSASALEKNLSENEPGARIFNVSTPYIEYSGTMKQGNWTLAPSVELGVSTTQRAVEKNKQLGYIDFSGTALYEFENSKWQPGVTGVIGSAFYNDSSQAFDVVGNDDARTDYYAGVYPFVEYAFNDRYSFRTLVGFEASHLRGEAADTFVKDVPYQSMGIGIVPMKGIYLYPNLQFVPEDIRADRTNVGLSTTINLF